MGAKVTVEYLGALRRLVEKPDETVIVGEGTTIRQLIEMLSLRYGESFRYTFLTANGNLRPDITILHNGKAILRDEELDFSIKQESVLQVLDAAPTFAGG